MHTLLIRLELDLIAEDVELGEAGSKKGSIEVVVGCGLWQVNVFAAHAVEFDRVDTEAVGEAHGQEALALTEDSGAVSKDAVRVLFMLQMHEIQHFDGGIVPYG